MKNRTQKSAALIGAGAVGLAAGAQADMHYTDAGGYTGSTIYFDLETGQFGANNVAVPGADFYLTASQTTGQDINEPKNTKTKQQYIVNSADGVAAIQTNFGNNAPERFDLNASVTPGAPSTTSGALYVAYQYDGDGTGTPPPPTNWSLTPPSDQGFLGLQFVIAGETHYGWADIQLNNDLTISLDGFAYEDVPNQGVLAGSTVSVPEPSTAGALIAGAAGVAALLRRRRMAER